VNNKLEKCGRKWLWCDSSNYSSICEWSLSHPTQNSQRYPFDRFDEPHSHSGHYGNKKNIFSVLEIRPQFLSLSAHNLDSFIFHSRRWWWWLLSVCFVFFLSCYTDSRRCKIHILTASATNIEEHKL
jgi:hypothetical protein